MRATADRAKRSGASRVSNRSLLRSVDCPLIAKNRTNRIGARDRSSLRPRVARHPRSQLCARRNRDVKAETRRRRKMKSRLSRRLRKRAHTATVDRRARADRLLAAPPRCARAPSSRSSRRLSASTGEKSFTFNAPREKKVANLVATSDFSARFDWQWRQQRRRRRRRRQRWRRRARANKKVVLLPSVATPSPSPSSSSSPHRRRRCRQQKFCDARSRRRAKKKRKKAAAAIGEHRARAQQAQRAQAKRQIRASFASFARSVSMHFYPQTWRPCERAVTRRRRRRNSTTKNRYRRRRCGWLATPHRARALIVVEVFNRAIERRTFAAAIAIVAVAADGR